MTDEAMAHPSIQTVEDGKSSRYFEYGLLLIAVSRYAVERTNSFIKVWFWPRNAGGIPSDVTNGASTVNTGNWVCLPFLTLQLYHSYMFS